MRVTASSFPNVLSQQLQRLSVEQSRLQKQASTGQRFALPSEDPRAMRKVLDLQQETSSLSQFGADIGTLQDTLTASFNSIKNVKAVSDRAGEIATQAADGLRTPSELSSYATEVDQLIEQAVQIGNTKNQSSYLFGGTANGNPPYVVTRDSDGKITGVTYQGNAEVPSADVAEGISVAVTVPGDNTTGSGPRGLFTDSRDGVNANFFGDLISLRDHLNAGDSTSISQTDAPGLLRDEDNIVFQYGNSGAVQARLQTAASTAQSRSSALDTLVSNASDADLAQTLVSLGEIQNAYTAALKTGGTILGQSLLDYI